LHPIGGYLVGWEMSVVVGQSPTIVSFSSTLGATKLWNP